MDESVQIENSYKLEKPIHRICVTGGPCSGKTTAINHLVTYLRNKGFTVFKVPSLLQIQKNGGGKINIQQMSVQQKCAYLGNQIQSQMDLENYFIKIAELYGQQAVVLFETGVMDVKSYIDDEQIWQLLIDQKTYNTLYLRDQRYDVVIHMETFSKQFVEYFYPDIQNKEHREQLIEESQKQDIKLQEIWNGHPHHIIINNSEKDLNEKLQRVCRGVDKFIGITTDSGFYKKYLVKDFEQQLPKDNQLIEKMKVEEIYLKNEDNKNVDYQYIRKRGGQGAYSYSITQRFVVEENKKKRQVIKKNITSEEYIKFFQFRDPNSIILRKNRYSIIHNSQSFVLERFKDNEDNIICILKVDSVDQGSYIIKHLLKGLPSWIQIEREITNDPCYSGKYLARKD